MKDAARRDTFVSAPCASQGLPGHRRAEADDKGRDRQRGAMVAIRIIVSSQRIS